MSVFIVEFMPDPALPFEVLSIGVFSSRELARAQCLDRRYFMTRLELDVALSHDSPTPGIEVIRPTCRAPDPELQARQLATLAVEKAKDYCKCCGGVKACNA